MGWNSTLVIANDYIHDISEDDQFGSKISKAISMVHHGEPVRIDGSRAVLVETHHNSHIVPVMVGGNNGIKMPCSPVKPEADPLDMLKAMADAMGYTLRKKPQRKG